MNKDQYYMDETYKIALNSLDNRKQVGAIIVKDDIIISKDCNSLPYGFDVDDPTYQSNPIKNLFMAHAERNAIYRATREGISTKGSSLFCTFHPCRECAISIAQSGINEVVLHTESPRTDTSWNESQLQAEHIFHTCGIKLRWWSGKPSIPYIRSSGIAHYF